jgi:hypothetical protein
MKDRHKIIRLLISKSKTIYMTKFLKTIFLSRLSIFWAKIKFDGDVNCEIYVTVTNTSI